MSSTDPEEARPVPEDDEPTFDALDLALLAFGLAAYAIVVVVVALALS